MKDNNHSGAASEEALAIIKQVINPAPESDREYLVAKIDEEQCIGCVKCIRACPFDAILGAAKQMHTVIDVNCTGCQLCIAPCPVDCIEMVTPPVQQSGWYSDFSENNNSIRHQAKIRYENRSKRIANKEIEKKMAREKKQAEKDKKQKQLFIQEAIKRSKAKRSNSI